MRNKFMSTAVILKNCKITNKKEISTIHPPKKYTNHKNIDKDNSPLLKYKLTIQTSKI